MARRAPRIAAIAATIGALFLVACDPPVQPLALTVDSTGTESDAAPGDGTCATATGTCTLIAALEEAAAAPAVTDITLPTGTYPIDATVEGDVRINWGRPADVQLVGSLTVATGSRLLADGLNAALPAHQDPAWGLRMVSAGEALVTRSILSSLDIRTDGLAVLDRTIVLGADWTNSSSAVRNRGVLVADDATILGMPQATEPVLDNTDAVAYLRSTAIATTTLTGNLGAPLVDGGYGSCAGGTIVDRGDVHIEVPCPEAGDGVSSGDARVFTRYIRTFPSPDPYPYFDSIWLEPDSPLIDATAIDGDGCTPTDTDLLGQPRGVDGNADGIGGCDIGALEHQPN